MRRPIDDPTTRLVRVFHLVGWALVETERARNPIQDNHQEFQTYLESI